MSLRGDQPDSWGGLAYQPGYIRTVTRVQCPRCLRFFHGGIVTPHWRPIPNRPHRMEDCT